MLQVSEHCSAGCNHCPFSKNERWFSVDDVVQQAKLNESGFVTITGGEPLEHPGIQRIVSKLQQLEIPYRLATGGHIDLASYEAIFDSPLFMGISLGTDVVSTRNCSDENKAMWEKNLNYIYHKDMSWSLTVTLGKGFEFSEVASFVGSKLPNFVMINAVDNDEMLMGAFKEDLKRNIQWKDVECL